MSINLDSKLLEKLQALGLNEKEAGVYAALVRGGEMSAITLSKVTGLHRQFIYNALASLKEKGLAFHIENPRSKWRAQSPRKLIALAEEKETIAEQAAEELLALKEERAGQEFEVTEGKSAFRSRILTTIRSIPPESTVLMICGEWGRYFEHAGEMVHAEWDRIRIAKKIKFRVIGPESIKSSMSEAAATRALMEFRTLPGLEKNLVNTVIYPDARVDFDIYGDPHITFSISNADVATSQAHFFETLWQMSNSK